MDSTNPYHLFVRAVENGRLHEATKLLAENTDLIRPYILAPAAGFLRESAKNNKMEMFKFLLDNGAPIHGDVFDAFNDICQDGNVDAVKRMLKAGAVLNVERDGELLSVPLRTAVSYNQLNVVRTLVEAGAVVNGLWNNRTNLSLAVTKGYNDIADYLRLNGGKMPQELVRGQLGKEPRSLIDETIEQYTLHFGFPLPKSQNSLLPQETPVSIHVIPISPNSQYITLFTNGLADSPMSTPPGKEEWSRAELFMQLPEDWKIDQSNDPTWGWPFQWLREIAQLPARNKTWFGGKVCIIDLGELTTGLRFRGCFMHDEHFYTSVTHPGTIVTLYRVIPLTGPELEFERAHGTENLLVAMDLVGVPPVVDIDRVDAAT